jgi:hypothetical protein
VVQRAEGQAVGLHVRSALVVPADVRGLDADERVAPPPKVGGDSANTHAICKVIRQGRT